jgi:hypothetical protein
MWGPVSTEPLWEAFHECSVDTGPGAVLLLSQHGSAGAMPELMDNLPYCERRTAALQERQFSLLLKPVCPETIAVAHQP